MTAGLGRLAAALALCLGAPPAAAAGVHAATPGAAPTGTVPTTLLEVSRFRYCHNAPCDPDAQGYVRGPSGPVDGGDNPAARIRVLPGARVTWTYRDDTCDAGTVAPLNCPGHEVRLENGTPGGSAPLGLLPARSGPVSLEWYVPADARPGSLIRYFCGINDHWALGLTGVLEVVSPRR